MVAYCGPLITENSAPWSSSGASSVEVWVNR